MLRKLYDWTMRLAEHRHANWALALVSFAESSFFPIPPDVVLVPMVLAQRHRAYVVATICTLTSVLVGMLGYAIGYFLFEGIGRPVMEFYGVLDKFAQFQNFYAEWGPWIVLAAGITPIPYKVFTIASGFVTMSVPAFAILSLVGRGVRFYAESWLLARYGEPIRGFIERYLGWLFGLFIVLLVAGFALLKFAL